MAKGIVYLIPSLLDEEDIDSIPSCILAAINECEVFFAENERTARRYLKKLQRDIVIDQYEWHTLSDAPSIPVLFTQKIKEGKKIGIISEAGCPGVADPGQTLVAVAHEWNALVKPLAGPNAILMALMASGMNGQRFQFLGYLPIKDFERVRAIKELEAESRKKNCTQIFIETPYRNNQLVDSLMKYCNPSTQLCIASAISSSKEQIHTLTISQWKHQKPDLHKVPTTFCLLAG
ncbi:MAG: SAM-dependent methyltransferase [Bacteroidetes bacterium]|nr:SAM-dependent methyltransferase [Bacteroidota bacterium]MBS1931082.1 SAM-dependent methyltransferase [Bacteroidota bacterium]